MSLIPIASMLSFHLALLIISIKLSAAACSGGPAPPQLIKGRSGFSLPLVVSMHHGLNYNADGDGFFSYDVQQQHLPSSASAGVANYNLTTIRPAIAAYAWSYGVQVGVGSGPSQHFHMLELDITSPLTWMQCAPSVPELPQASPIFVSSGSPSYNYVGKRNYLCAAPYTPAEPNMCSFHVTAAQGGLASARGYLGLDNFFFTGSFGGNNVETVQRIVFGCAHTTEGFQSHGTLAGVLSMSRHRFSLMRQLKNNLGISQFSYCLGGNHPTFLRFGDDISYPSNTRHTGMYQRQQDVYRMRVVGVILDGRRILRITPIMFRGGKTRPLAGGSECVIDIGAPMSRMIRVAYDILEGEVAAHLSRHGAHPPINTVPGHRLCILDSRENRARLPSMALEFEMYKGIRFDIKPELLFVAVSYESVQYLCFTIEPDEDQTMLGAMHQLGTQFIFDLAKNEISFAHAQC